MANVTTACPHLAEQLMIWSADRERFRERAVAENLRESAPVLRDLAAAGFPVATIAGLRHQPLDYRRAIPILLRWLPLVQRSAVKEDIVRNLSVKWAKPFAAQPLIDEFLAADDRDETGLKWAIGNALSVVADDGVFDQLVALARDRRHHSARQMVVVALGKMRDARSVDVLIELLDDDEVAGHALMALRKLKAARARPHVERFLHHPKTWVRAEAKKALAKMGDG